MKTTGILLAIFVTVVIFCNGSVCADLLWDGGGDGFSVFQESNWVDTTTGTDPLPGSVDPTVDVLFNIFVDGDVVAGGGGGAGQFEIGSGFSLTLSDSAFWNSNSASGIAGELGGPTETLSFFDASGAATRFVFGLDVVLNDDVSLILRGPNNPVNNATIDFNSLDATLLFNNETVDDVISEHLNKFTVFGNQAILGSNLIIEDIGGVTSVQAIPEPSSFLLIALASAALFRPNRIR